MKAHPKASEEVARLLYLLEQGIDDAIAHAGRLASAISEARREERLSAVVGQPAFAYAAQSLSAVSSARGHIVQLHRHLSRIAAQEGIAPVSFGEEKPKPKDGFFVGADASEAAAEA